MRRFSSSSSNDIIQSAFCIQMHQTFRILHLPRASMRARARKMPSLHLIRAKNAVFYLFWHSSASLRVNRCCLKGQQMLPRVNFITSAFKRTLNHMHEANTAKVSSTQSPSDFVFLSSISDLTLKKIANFILKFWNNFGSILKQRLPILKQFWNIFFETIF